MERENLETLKEIPQIRGLLVGLSVSNKVQDESLDESMEELEELAKAAGVEVVAVVVQNRPAVHVAYYIGKGKVQEISELCKHHEIDLVIFNDELSGSQIRNLEEVIGVDVIDRTTLILDIFAQRAQTKEGKLQVELAQLKYRLPRLTGLGKQLSRQGGGIGTRGPGEMKLETDRRHILRRIDDIRGQLKDVKKVRETQRAQRLKSDLPIVALVGYTNAGKSSLMNAFLRQSEDYDEKREVYAKNQLFATLDTSLRKIILSNKFEFLLTDTVGFVSKLPHDLVDAFKSTLEEVKYADLLIHVIDASNQNYELQKLTTLKVLKELGVDNKKIIDVFNKCDLLQDLSEAPKSENAISISAITGKNLDQLIRMIDNMIGKKILEISLLIPYNKGNIVSQLHKEAEVLSTEYQESGIVLNVNIEENYYEKYKEFHLA
ncbi:GTPase HflX [Clostridium formicaceticum]|uniref:GTPase HflX n=1 Tax=Clostridium formicaceticum TaxID=1497 RepID=A0AAC9RKK7_9CLOT|nr:GTPase HflX [Clostridium formicaceticum]AOY76817.1 GTPase HflX [Clostridium formicaceticum]ARE87287.1 GTPase HflX [Clostridium formicaceticum]